MAQTLETLTVFLTADTKRFDKGIDRSLKRIGIFRKDINAAGKAIGIFAGIAVAAGAKVVSAYNEQADAVAKLDAVLMATNESAGFTSDQLVKMAGDLQDVTAIGDETIITMQSVLATFKNIKGDEFKKATGLILDMSKALQVDLKSAALQVGKALNDPVLGVTALSRAGIQFTQDQRDMIKEMVEANDILGAQAIILKELEGQFGGVAEAMAKTDAGQLKMLLDSIGDLEEAMGAVVAKTLGIGTAAGSAKDQVKALTDFIQQNADEFAMTVRVVAGETKTVWDNIQEGLTEAITFAILEGEREIEVLRKLREGDLRALQGPASTEAKMREQALQESQADSQKQAERLFDEEVNRLVKAMEERVKKEKKAIERVEKARIKSEADLVRFVKGNVRKLSPLAEPKAPERMVGEQGFIGGIIGAVISGIGGANKIVEDLAKFKPVDAELRAVERGSVEAFKLEKGTETDQEKALRIKNAKANADAAETLDDIKQDGIKFAGFNLVTF